LVNINLILEIWGRAQREAARRCKSDWGQNLGEGRVKIPLVATSRVPNAVTLAYTARAVLIVGGSTCAPITFLLVDQSSSFFSSNVGAIVVDHLLSRFLIYLSFRDIFAIEVWRCPKIAPNFGRFFCRPKFFGAAPPKSCTQIIMPVRGTSSENVSWGYWL